MRFVALFLAGTLSACASTYAANPNDPVDMAAELGNRGRAYVGMGEICDAAAGGTYRDAIVQTVAHQQQRLGPLADLVNRAYRGHPTTELAVHMQAQMHQHGLSAQEFCGVVVTSAVTDLDRRTSYVLSLSGQPDLMALQRNATRAPYTDTPSFDPLDGYLAWVE